MNSKEVVEKLLEMYRSLAVAIQEHLDRFENDYAESPALQAEHYDVASAVALVDGILGNIVDAEEISGMTAEGHRELLRDIAGRLRKRYGAPDKALRGQAMVKVLSAIHTLEKGLVNWGFSLPEWERPLWLKELEEENDSGK